MPNATAIAPIRTRAIAQSLMLTRSTPASPSRRAASMVRSMRTERGGSISTRDDEATGREGSGEAGRRRVGVVGAVAGRPGDGAWRAPRPARRRRDGPRSPWRRGARRRGARRVEGHAHRRDVLGRRPAAAADDRAPAATNRGDHVAEVGRVPPHRRTGPRPAAGSPAFGRISTARSPRHRGRARPGSASGPTPQLTPIDVDAGRDEAPAAAPGGRPVAAARAPRRRSAARRSAGRPRPAPPRPRARRWSSRRERLDHEQVDAALEEAVDAARGRPPGSPASSRWSSSRVGGAERSDRAGDEDVAAGHVAGLAGELGAATVQPPGLVARARTAPGGPGWPRTWRSR